MLLDGALRFGRQALQMWNEGGDPAEADRLLGRTLDIVEELVRSVAGETHDASQRLEEEYAFAFRQLAAAQLHRDASGLQSALGLLEFHRETWKLACKKLKPVEPGGSTPSAPPSPRLDVRRPIASASPGAFQESRPGLSLEA
jgi:flagellar secretion chaperone FliS